jgi:cell division transport system permease protein
MWKMEGILMKFSSVKYYIHEGFTGLFKNSLMTVASIATVAACIFIVAVSCCLLANMRSMMTQIEKNIGISVFLEDKLSPESITMISEQMKRIPHVSSVTYISPDDALEELKKEWNADEVLSGFDNNNNPLSSSFEISIDNIEYQKDVISEIKQIDGVRNIRNAQNETDILLKLNKVISIVGLLSMLILAAISVVIITNTIKISVYTRKTEINIMKYVGATDWFIRWPFIVEGVLIGIIGALVPLIISWPLYDKCISLIYVHLPFIGNIAHFLSGYTIFSVLIPLCILAGILLGVIGSVTSIHKHLNV